MVMIYQYLKPHLFSNYQTLLISLVKFGKFMNKVHCISDKCVHFCKLCTKQCTYNARGASRLQIA